MIKTKPNQTIAAKTNAPVAVLLPIKSLVKERLEIKSAVPPIPRRLDTM